MTGPGDVVLESNRNNERFRNWAQTARSHGAQVWMQINHPGRQMPTAMGQETLAPSVVAINLGNFSKQFRPPKAMTEVEIQEVKHRFIQTAVLAEQLGFNGVQVHAAHGYLLSQFLSPLTNQREDSWGGPLVNRARLLIEVVEGIRKAVSGSFAVSVKLNSADFQRGGFSPEDAKQVIALLNPLGVDLLELSGGSYEAPAMHGQARDGRTLAREAYFLEFAKDIAVVAQMPIMVTGGIRRYSVAEQVLASGIDMVGIATALAVNPSLPNAWRIDSNTSPILRAVMFKNKVLASVAYMAMVKHQLRRLSQGQPTQPNVPPIWALMVQEVETKFKNWAYRRWIQKIA
jgi:2,4-dienoyl-CoA reductase (NADPH2)